MGDHTLNIVRDALNGRQVLLARVVNMKAHLMNDIGMSGRVKVRY
jgi:hypothetical protein